MKHLLLRKKGPVAGAFFEAYLLTHFQDALFNLKNQELLPTA
ncbi:MULTISPECIES: hypothetical protein [unclassified Lysobacter]|nr:MULTISPECIES: hypothetical protein [unclassified Lysobacter]